jgi:hypothetical protein
MLHREVHGGLHLRTTNIIRPSDTVIVCCCSHLLMQRNALSWMLHREVHGGQQLAHPFIMKFVTSSGLPFYADQVRCVTLLPPFVVS